MAAARATVQPGLLAGEHPVKEIMEVPVTLTLAEVVEALALQVLRLRFMGEMVVRGSCLTLQEVRFIMLAAEEATVVLV